MKKKIYLVMFALLLVGCNDDENNIEKNEVEKVEAKEKVKAEKPKKLTIEEQSKQFINENLDGKSIVEFTKALISLDNEKLESMIIYGHKDGQQIIDDFDLIGRTARATGKIIDFVDQSHNTYNDRGKKNGSVTFTREDKFYIYMGDKNIDDFEKIEYDSLYHSEQDINDFFLGVYPEEIINFATIDLDEEATLNIGDTITVEGRIDNYVLRRDYSNRNNIDEYYVVIDNAHIKK